MQSVLGFYLVFFLMFWNVLCFTGVLGGWRFYLLLGVLEDFWGGFGSCLGVSEEVLLEFSEVFDGFPGFLSTKAYRSSLPRGGGTSTAPTQDLP